jgi:hypothetical protein
MSTKERAQDFLLAIIGFSVASTSFIFVDKLRVIPSWVFKFGCHGGILVMLMYCYRLKLAAEGIDPESREAFREYLKFGSFYCAILFIMELPMMLAVL